MASETPLPALLPSKCTFVDDSTECAICFEVLDETCNSPRRVVTLGCGHKWHLDCLVQQLKVGSMTASNDDKRLLFHSIQCGKCGTVFSEDDHPDLPKDILRSTDKLLQRVNTLIDEHHLLEDEEEKIGHNGRNLKREALYKEARRKYAFYLCSHCKDPYFGGTVACADGFNEERGEAANDLAPEARLCPSCAPQSQTVCQNPSEHGRFLVWKCRYCCQPATTVCYGNVHFCQSCHDRNSELGGRKFLTPIPCPGGKLCQYPRPPKSLDEEKEDDSDCWCHSNGPSQECEQVYSCVLCASMGHRRTNDIGGDPLAIAPGSKNFLVNPSGQDGLRGWRQINPRMSWKVEGASEREQEAIPDLWQTPVMAINDAVTDISAVQNRPPITTNFVSSFLDCAMTQSVDLTKFLKVGRNYRNSNTAIPQVIRIEVSARYTGRTDCPSVFCLQAMLSDGDPSNHGRDRYRSRSRNSPPQQPPRRRMPLPPQRLSSGTLEAPPGVYWERTSLEFALDTISQPYDQPVVTVVVLGKDARFWQGNFGSKVADITVRVVGLTPAELGALVVTEGDESTGDELPAHHDRENTTHREENPPFSRWAMIVVFGVWFSWWWHINHGS